MKFSCDRCGKKYATADDPAPGRVYKLKCKACGHLIVVKPGAPAAPPPFPSATPPEIPLEIGVPEPMEAAPRAKGARVSRAFDATTHVAMPPPAAEEPTPPPVDGGYVDLFSDTGLTGAEEVGSPPDPFMAAARGSLPDTFGAGPPGLAGLPDPFAPLREITPHETATPEPPPPRAPMPKVPVIPKPGQQRSIVPIALMGGGVALLVGILAFVILSPGKRAPTTTAAAPVESAAPVAAAPVPTPVAPSRAEPPPVQPQPTPIPRPDLAAEARKAEAEARKAEERKAEADARRAEADARRAEADARKAEERRAAEERRRRDREEAAARAEQARAQRAEQARAERADKAERERLAREAKEREKREREERAREAREAKERAAREAREARERAAREREERVAAASSQEDAAEGDALSQGQIEGVLRASKPSFDACMRAAQGSDVRLDGRRVMLRLNIQPTGAVTYPTIDDVTVNGADLGSCIKSAARLMVFPKFKGDTMHVEVPLALAGR